MMLADVIKEMTNVKNNSRKYKRKGWEDAHFIMLSEVYDQIVEYIDDEARIFTITKDTLYSGDWEESE